MCWLCARTATSFVRQSYTIWLQGKYAYLSMKYLYERMLFQQKAYFLATENKQGGILRYSAEVKLISQSNIQWKIFSFSREQFLKLMFTIPSKTFCYKLCFSHDCEIYDWRTIIVFRIWYQLNCSYNFKFSTHLNLSYEVGFQKNVSWKTYQFICISFNIISHIYRKLNNHFLCMLFLFFINVPGLYFSIA